MALTSITLVPTTTFGTASGNYDGSSTTFYSDKQKGDGYYGYTDGLHTVAYYMTNFVGNITMQATLAKDPTEADWFDITTTASVYDGSTALTDQEFYNFTGNFVWVRAKISDFTAGTIRKIVFNY